MFCYFPCVTALPSGRSLALHVTSKPITLLSLAHTLRGPPVPPTAAHIKVPILCAHHLILQITPLLIFFLSQMCFLGLLPLHLDSGRF